MVWKLGAQLGEGGTGEVFEAVSPEGIRVALKVLAAPQTGSLLEHEAGLLLRLRHPSVAAFLGYSKTSSDIFGADRGPCLWVEFVPGTDLLEAAASCGRNPHNLRSWLIQALEALEFLHSQNVLHGDLSPSNIRVDDAGRLKLIDFGTASFGKTVSSLNAATLKYLAPERIGGKNGPACDLFSLGTLFYEAAAGVHPRAGCASLREMTRRPAVPLAEKRPDFASGDAILARTIDRLIAIDPSDRFAAASEALEALKGGRASISDSPKTFYPVRLLGADASFAAVDAALAHLGQKSSAFALHGVTGTGKSRFLRETAFQCALAGIPLKEAGPSAFRETLAGLDRASGAVIFHDVQSVPAAELSLLLRKPRRAAPGLLIFLEWNDDRVTDENRRVLEALSSHPNVGDLRLENLSEALTAELVRSALGTQAPAALGATLHRLTGGNPKMLLEIISELKQRSAADANFRPESLDAEGFAAFQKGRIASLPLPERRALELLAAAHWPAGLDDLARAAGPEAETLETVLALDGLIAKGLASLDAETGRYRLDGAGLEKAVLEGAGEAGCELLHRSWRAALAGGPEEDARLLHHALALGDTGTVARIAPAVLEKLRTSRDFSETLRLSESALELLRKGDDTAAVSRVLRVRGNAFNDLGRYADALAIAEEVYALAAPDEPMPVKTVKHWLVTGLIFQNLGQRGEAVKRFEKLLEEAERLKADVPATYAMRARVLLGVEALRRGEPESAKNHLEAALACKVAVGWRRAEILRNLAEVAHRQKEEEGAGRLLEDARALYRAEGEATEGEYACRLEEGNFAVDRRDFSAAEAAYDAAEAIARARDESLLFAGLWNNRGVMERKRGDLGLSLEHLTAALGLFRALGNASDLSECLKQAALTEAEVGRFAAAAAKIAEIQNLAAPGAEEKISEIGEALSRLRDGVGARQDPDLKNIYGRLPKALRVSFEDRFDFKQWGKT